MTAEYSEYLDRTAPGWFALAVVREKGCGWDWVAFMIACAALDDMMATRQ